MWLMQEPWVVLTLCPLLMRVPGQPLLPAGPTRRLFSSLPPHGPAFLPASLWPCPLLASGPEHPCPVGSLDPKYPPNPSWPGLTHISHPMPGKLLHIPQGPFWGFLLKNTPPAHPSHPELGIPLIRALLTLALSSCVPLTPL